jgi:hypothetical protein
LTAGIALTIRGLSPSIGAVFSYFLQITRRRVDISSALLDLSSQIKRPNKATMPPIRNYMDHEWTDFEACLSSLKLFEEHITDKSITDAHHALSHH